MITPAHILTVGALLTAIGLYLATAYERGEIARYALLVWLCGLGLIVGGFSEAGATGAIAGPWLGVIFVAVIAQGVLLLRLARRDHASVREESEG